MRSFKEVLKELHPEPITSGQIIRAIRKSLGFTLKDVEAISGIRESHLSALENDSYELTKKYAEKLAATLGVHPNGLLFPEGYQPDPELKAMEKKAKKLLASRG